MTNTIKTSGVAYYGPDEECHVSAAYLGDESYEVAELIERLSLKRIKPLSFDLSGNIDVKIENSRSLCLN